MPRSLSGLLSRMRCRAKKRVRKARGAADIAHIGKPSNAADTLFGSNPKGRERFGRLSWQISALLALAIVALLLRAPALNRAQIAPRRMRESKPDRLLAARPHRARRIAPAASAAHRPSFSKTCMTSPDSVTCCRA